MNVTQIPGNNSAKDIMHVGTVVGTGTKPCDVELAQLLLFGQLDVMAEVAVVTLNKKNKLFNKFCIFMQCHEITKKTVKEKSCCFFLPRYISPRCSTCRWPFLSYLGACRCDSSFRVLPLHGLHHHPTHSTQQSRNFLIHIYSLRIN